VSWILNIQIRIQCYTCIGACIDPSCACMSGTNWNKLDHGSTHIILSFIHARTDGHNIIKATKWWIARAYIHPSTREQRACNFTHKRERICTYLYVYTKWLYMYTFRRVCMHLGCGRHAWMSWSLMSPAGWACCCPLSLPLIARHQDNPTDARAPLCTQRTNNNGRSS
jgi:hypothetical protein